MRDLGRLVVPLLLAVVRSFMTDWRRWVDAGRPVVAADTTEALDDDGTKWRSLLASLSAKVVVLRNWGRGNDEFLADFVVVVVVLDVVATVAALVPLNTSSNNCDADLINFLRGCCCCCGGVGEGSFVTKG